MANYYKKKRNTSENTLNEIIYMLCIEQEKLIKRHITVQ